MTSSIPSPLPQYRVIGISSGQYEADGAGNPIKGRIVHYQLGDGTVDQVFVPDTQWSLGTAQTLIEAAVTRTADVRALANGM